MKKYLITLLFALYVCVLSIHAQNITKAYSINYNKDKNIIQYPFLKDKNPSGDELLRFYIVKLLPYTENLSIFHNLGYPEDSICLLKADSIIKNVDNMLVSQAEKLVFKDLNADGSLDVIADLYHPDWLSQFIFIGFKNRDLSTYNYLKLPGYIILDMNKANDTLQILSWEWACCDNIYQYFYTTTVVNSKIVEVNCISNDAHIEFPKENELLKDPENITIKKTAYIYYKAEQIPKGESDGRMIQVTTGEEVLHIATRSEDNTTYYYVRYYTKQKLGLRESNACEGWIASYYFS